MASTETLQKRVSGAEKNLEKLNKKMERILKAKATDWEVNPYWYSERDIECTQHDIDEQTEKLNKYKEELEKAIEKDNSRDVEAIVKFLEGWKQNVRNYYHKTAEQFPKAYEQYRKDLKPFYEVSYFEERKMKREDPEAWKEWNGRREAIKQAFAARFGHLEQYRIGMEFEWDRFERDIKNEANRKYDFIIERTNAIVGQITDATNLYVGDKGDLNGYIIGTKATAKVQTIGAGGYNIQCYHFRTLINRMK